MRTFCSDIALATAICAAALPSATSAQTNIPVPAINDNDLAIHGAGSTSIESVLVQELNCIAKHNQLNGNIPIAEPTNLPITGGGTLDCSQDPPTPSLAIEPNFNAKFVGTGSGFARQVWRRNTNQFGGTVPNGFETIPSLAWNTVQFAFADSSIRATDLSGDYAANILPTGGAAIMFPKYVLPIAFAYSPVYGRKNGTIDLRFNVRAPKAILGVAAGGLQLNARTYCKIWNGQIVNWNNPEITADNTPVGGPISAATSLMDTVNDAAVRWNADGVPIRLVGRMDLSGATDIFTRHLSTVCADTSILPSGNKFSQHAETLPYSRGVLGTPDFGAVRTDTGLSGTSLEPVAGAINSVGNQYFNGLFITNAGVTGGISSMPIGAQGSGLFLVVDGSRLLAAAIRLAPDYPSPSDMSVLLNGKIGYIGADFIPPSPTAPTPFLHAAALKRTSNPALPAAYMMPSAANATTAISATTPPAATFIARSNPLNWYDALYPILANPSSGYPVTGTTLFLGYTCYKPGNLENVSNFLQWNVQSITTDYAGTSRAGIFTAVGVSPSASGLLPRSNIGVMPSNWRTAIFDTFFSDPNNWDLDIVLGFTAPQCAFRSGM